jgi:hypothetical protein
MNLLKPSNKQNIKRWSMFMAVLCLGVISQLSFAGPREQAKRIHDRLAGVPPTHAVLDQMVAQMGNPEAAAAIAMQNPAFYNVTLKNFATPWTNEEQTVFAPLNDYSATVIGMIRDDRDFREVLYGNYLYKGTAAYNPNNNTHYEDLERQGVDLSDPANLDAVPQSSVNPGVVDPAGIMTTRAAARAFFVDGTNRAMLRFTFINHLCVDFEQIKDNTRPSDRIRQDVTRSPGGDSRIFNNECLSCHAGMDPLNQAYAYYEWNYSGDPDGGNIEYTKFTTGVTAKHLINPDNFKYGYIIQDDSWSNYWRHGPNKNRIGWGTCPGVLDDKGICHGNGAATMGQELANSDAFANCQVQKVFKSVCFRQPTNTELTSITGSFKLDYNMKNVFAKAAVACMGN